MPVRASLTRREALQGIGLAGLGAVITACGGGGNGSGSAATATAPSETATPAPSSSPTRAANATSTPLPAATTPASTATASAAPSASPTRAATQTPTPPPSPSPTPAADTPTQTPSATVTPGSVSCVLRPQQTQGPYFLDLDLVRSDVREDRDGVQLRLALRVVDVDNDCAPIRDAVVAIWHADAAGAYSGFAGQPGGVDTTGQTFLRGFQVTDAAGHVEFVTIYPGWYPGRTPHIHLTIHLGSSSVLTSQMYFDDALTDAVYAQAPYDTRPGRDTTNDSDGIIRSGGVTALDQVVLEVVAEGSAYASTPVIGVTGS